MAEKAIKKVKPHAHWRQPPATRQNQATRALAPAPCTPTRTRSRSSISSSKVLSDFSEEIIESRIPKLHSVFFITNLFLFPRAKLIRNCANVRHRCIFSLKTLFLQKGRKCLSMKNFTLVHRSKPSSSKS